MLQKLYKHLEEINTNTRQHHEDLANDRVWSEKISGQLEAINTSLLAQKKYHLSRGLLWTCFTIGGLALIMGILLTWQGMQLSKATQVALQQTSKTNRVADYALIGYRESMQRQAYLEAQTARLDSLVQEQSQTINELRKLNLVAIRAFFQLKKNIELQESRLNTGQSEVREK